MCGIAGAYSFAGELAPQVVAAVAQTTEQLRHRGPDAAGTWVSPDRRAALAATRLAIRDLRSVADQPFATEQGCTVYNGELYDWPSQPLRGSSTRTSGDTEVIHALMCTDPKRLSQVSGMYAVATWRAASQSLVLARDPAGEKPLYIARHRGWLAFASELNVLVKTGLLAPEIDRDALAMLLRLGHVPEPLSIYKGAQPLKAGSSIELQADGHEATHSWWPAPLTAASLRRPENVRTAVIEAVQKATVSDVPTGLFLSGGVDSSVIAAAAHASGANLSAFTLRAPGTIDESVDAAATARHLHLQHEVVEMTPDGARAHLPAFFRAMDQPTVDGFNSYLICRAARSAGLVVALSGVGGDELFRGYKTFASMERWRWLRYAPRREALLWGMQRFGFRHERFGDYVRARSTRQAYIAVRGVLGADRSERLLGGSVDWGQIEGRLDLPTYRTVGDQETSLLETHGYMRNQLLRDIDVFAMACSLEVRAPLLSPALIGLAGALPNDRRLRGKRLLVEAFRADLPSGLLDHSKHGFVLPWEQWLRTSLRETTLESLRGLSRTQGLVDPVQADRLYTEFERGHLHWSAVWVVAALCQWAAVH
jgi:asparagine synthase (glutamine-hydrolysing)